MRKKKLLKAGIVAASFAAMVPVATMDVFAEETEETSVVAEAEAENKAEDEADEDVAAPAVKADVSETDVSETDVTEAENLSDSPSFAPEEKSGWVEEDGGWRYYYGSGSNDYYKSGLYEINKRFYYFRWNGLMLDNESTSYYDSEKQRSVYVRAKEGGILYRGEWYQSDDSWYYYGSDCYSAYGPVTVGKKTYLFGYSGNLIRNYIDKFDNIWYVSDEEGIATALPTKDGWAQVNGNYYYIQDGDPVKDAVIKVGSAYYGFAYNGVMRANTSFSKYDYDIGKSYYYRAKADGKLYCNEWFRSSDWDSWRYYGADGKSASGITTINKKTYIFRDYDSGMYADTVMLYDGKPYIIDENGVATLAKEGWNKVGTTYYYVQDGDFVKDTVLKIGSGYYGFRWDGKMYDNETFDVDGLCYRAKEGGALYQNTWYYNYYYHSDGVAGEGLETIGGKQYYFEDGKAVQGQFFLVDGELYHADGKCVVTKVTKDGFYYHNANRSSMSFVSGGKVLKNEWKKSGGKYYYFDEDGYALTEGIHEVNGRRYLFDHDGAMAESGWKLGNRVYVTGSGALATGDMKIGGIWYYFDEYGDKQTGLVETEAGLFLYGPDGAYIGKATGSGWNQIKGTYYYVHSDGSVAKGLKTIGKNDYYFDASGVMVTDEINWIDSGNMLFKSNGQRLMNGWYQLQDNWYYAEDGYIVRNTNKTINGKEYYFNYSGAMVISSFIQDDDLINIGSNGVVTSKKHAANGWTLVNGNYHYYKDGARYTGWLGDYYFADGSMVRNTYGDGYWLGYDGKYQKTVGWAVAGVPGDQWETGYYVKKGGKLAKNEWLQIGGKWYYFGSYYSRYTGLNEIGGVYYIFNADGTMQTTIGKSLPNGWVQAGSEYYYFESGDIINGDYEINGKVYSFSYSLMIKNSFNGEFNYRNVYYCDSKGYAQTGNKGWKQISGNWFYFGENNKTSMSSWSTQGTAQYYSNYGMVTGTQVIQGKLYTFNANGALVKEHSVQNGWYAYEGAYYYFKNGEALTDTLVNDKGKIYLIGWDGKLVKNSYTWASTSSYGATFYADANGVIVTNTWKKVDGRDRYFGSDGRMLSGIQKINGKVYYFD